MYKIFFFLKAYFLGISVEVVLEANRKNVSELYKIQPIGIVHRIII